MSAGEELREAARLMRERAEATFVASVRWEVTMFPGDHERPESHRSYLIRSEGARVANDIRGVDATYIAAMDPTVALAVADWLDGVRFEHEFADGEDPVIIHHCSTLAERDAALAVARAYLRGDS